MNLIQNILGGAFWTIYLSGVVWGQPASSAPQAQLPAQTRTPTSVSVGVQQPKQQLSGFSGYLGLGTLRATGAFRNFKTQAGYGNVYKPLFVWDLGEWRWAGFELQEGLMIQKDDTTEHLARLVTPYDGDFTLEVEFRRSSVSGYMQVFLGGNNDVAHPAHYRVLFGGPGDAVCLIEQLTGTDTLALTGRVPCALETNRWYTMRLEATSGRLRVMLDGRQVLQYTLPGIARQVVRPEGYDLVVAPDGTGDYVTIQEAVMSVRDYTPIPKKIFIRKGAYREKLVIPSWKCDITLVGEDRDATIITWNDHANIRAMGTFRTHTLLVQGNDITLENLTIENNAPQLGQAVALHVEGDRFVARRCRILGNQDTVFTGNEMSRQWYEACYIEGTTDFIFGPATAWFEQCVIHSKRESYITAASTPAEHPIGYVFNRCQLTAASGVQRVYLGRPWRAYAAVVFQYCDMGKHIRPEGWENWRDPANEKTARYAEYNNTGPGADRSGRVGWSRELSRSEASRVTLQQAFRGWNPGT